jgi:hypothetical protein
VPSPSSATVSLQGEDRHDERLITLTADGLNPKKATRRMIRRLGEPIDYHPPAFASEPGEKEKRTSKL